MIGTEVEEIPLDQYTITPQSWNWLLSENQQWIHARMLMEGGCPILLLAAASPSDNQTT